MTNALVHRGPDDEGFFNFESHLNCIVDDMLGVMKYDTEEYFNHYNYDLKRLLKNKYYHIFKIFINQDINHDHNLNDKFLLCDLRYVIPFKKYSMIYHDHPLQ